MEVSSKKGISKKKNIAADVWTDGTDGTETQTHQACDFLRGALCRVHLEWGVRWNISCLHILLVDFKDSPSCIGSRARMGYGLSIWSSYIVICLSAILPRPRTDPEGEVYKSRLYFMYTSRQKQTYSEQEPMTVVERNLNTRPKMCRAEWDVVVCCWVQMKLDMNWYLLENIFYFMLLQCFVDCYCWCCCL